MNIVFKSLCAGLLFFSTVNSILTISMTTMHPASNHDVIFSGKQEELPHENGLKV
ncbi:hypothetical protein ACE3MZ_04175 [Paenibacillus sp. WLX1005]|uniref:hypothetical protein n=1 Tax=Paenibacillus sp. WLX1005 TaxID=3243766 RepID=UPI003983E951